MKRKLINVFITLVVGLIYFYFAIPAINLTNPSFYVFVAFLLLVYGALNAGSSAVEILHKGSVNGRYGFNTVMLIPCMFLLIVIANLFVTPLFDSKGYASRIAIDETGSFSDDIAPVDFKRVPLLDKDSSQKLGDRTMGEMSDLVSQYYVSDLYTQINYNEDIVRVTPLDNADIINYISNHKDR